MSALRVHYDEKMDILYLAVPSAEGYYSEELCPGITVEIGDTGAPIGIEIMAASRVLKDFVAAVRDKVHQP